MHSEPGQYLETLLLYYEEEVMGEAYFNSLADGFSEDDQKEKMRLLAAVERKAADAVLPLIVKYNLSPRSDHELHRLGQSGVNKALVMGWPGFIEHMIKRYPDYMPEFHALEAMAPLEDLDCLKTLTYHEVITIEFAKLEAEGDPQSEGPLRAYLAFEDE
ncbi:MAG: hypothetical protein ACR2O3_03775 [Rhizobiaceae bacterium]